MNDPQRRGFPAAPAAFTLLSAAFVVLLTGCASQGPLKPPSLHLPAPARGLEAERIGDGVDLHWTSPTRTTDGQPLTGKHVPTPIQAEICRVETTVLPCRPVGRVSVTSGEVEHFHDPLPAALTLGSLRALSYRVCILNGAGRGAACSTVESLAGAAPTAMRQVEATLVQSGVLIRWQPVPGSNDDRILLRVTREQAGSASSVTAHATPRPDEVLLAIALAGHDPGGALDTGAKAGVAQHYSVARTQTVRLGGQDLVMSGTPARVTVAADAALPPAAPPTSLEAVVNTLGPPEIDLVWQPGAGAAGYLIFRAIGAGQPIALTTEPIQGLTYTDKDVKPAIRYRYSIASIGPDGKPGRRCPEVVEQVPDR